MNKELIISQKTIKNKIFTIRNIQVMIDEDLAELYCVSVKVLNQALKRNSERFPEDFAFQLNEEEYTFLRSQMVTTKSDWSKKRYFPHVFTEQGVAMLSGILRSRRAIEVNVQIMRAFVAMRYFLVSNAQIFRRLDRIELKQIEQDNHFENVFKALENHEQKQGIFYDGQIFDAYVFVSSLIKKAKKRIILIDNYIDESVLILLSKRKKNVNVIVYTKKSTELEQLDIEKFNSQYEPVDVRKFENSHDRFLIIDEDIYHFGASLKDLGKKWFAFSKFERGTVDMLKKLE